MKSKLTAVLLMSIGPVLVMAQNKKKAYTDCAGVKRYYAMKGDAVTFSCDSVVLLNLKTYHALDSSYIHLHTVATNLVMKTDSASFIYRKLFDDKSKQYDELKQEFLQFRDSTSHYISSVSVRLDTADRHIVSAKTQMDNGLKSIDTAIGNINKSNNKKWWDRLIAGAIGFAFAGVLFVATK